MKNMVVANQKGGVGKTSFVVHLAFYFAEQGKKVVVIDGDTQGNASHTLQLHRSGSVASQVFTGDTKSIKDKVKPVEGGVVLIEADAGLADIDKHSLSDASVSFKQVVSVLDGAGFDLCIVDTPPSLGNAMVASLFSADYVLSPIELEVYSIKGIKKMMATISNVKKRNKKLRFLGMAASKVDGRNPRHRAHLEELSKAFPSLMLPTAIGLRSSIADALSKGVPVWKIKKTAARVAGKEVKALASYVSKEMGFK